MAGRGHSFSQQKWSPTRRPNISGRRGTPCAAPPVANHIGRSVGQLERFRSAAARGDPSAARRDINDNSHDTTCNFLLLARQARPCPNRLCAVRRISPIRGAFPWEPPRRAARQASWAARKPARQARASWRRRGRREKIASVLLLGLEPIRTEKSIALFPVRPKRPRLERGGSQPPTAHTRPPLDLDGLTLKRLAWIGLRTAGMRHIRDFGKAVFAPSTASDRRTDQSERRGEDDGGRDRD